MSRRTIELVELLSYSLSLTLGGIVAIAMVYTKIIGTSCITFTFNDYHEHLVEAIIFPASSLLSLIFLFARTNRLGKLWKN